MEKSTRGAKSLLDPALLGQTSSATQVPGAWKIWLRLRVPTSCCNTLKSQIRHQNCKDLQSDSPIPQRPEALPLLTPLTNPPYIHKLPEFRRPRQRPPFKPRAKPQNPQSQDPPDPKPSKFRDAAVEVLKGPKALNPTGAGLEFRGNGLGARGVSIGTPWARLVRDLLGLKRRSPFT